jgi:class 3 adenylate cyclase
VGRLADRLPWRRTIRPEIERRQFRLIAALFLGGGGSGLIGATAVDEGVLADPGGLLVVALGAIGIGLLMLVGASRDSAVLHRHFRLFAYALMIGGGAVITAAQVAVGPVSLAPVVLYVAVPIFAVYHVPPTTAAVLTALVAAEFGALLALQDGYVAAGWTWIFVTTSLFTLGLVFGGLLGGASDEVSQLAQLQRFLAPSIADVVVSRPDLLAPHREQVAVLFVDLRGFTRFASSAEPEEVVEVLDSYYATVGRMLHDAQGTVGSFAGDGIMAVFNDPLPMEDPAGHAVDVAIELRVRMDDLTSGWRRMGFTLGYGVGVAFGHATVGMFGFDARHDYTALGPVVNLASRLCQAAGDREVLLDQRTAGAVGDRYALEHRQLEVKGLDGSISAYAVQGSGATGATT